MTRKIYRSAMGKMVDIGALQLRNENVRAVGNMSVNARGDLLDSKNQPIDSRNNQVARSYKRQTGNVSNTKVTRAPTVSEPIIAAPPEDFNDNFVKSKSLSNQVQTTSGLAAAIAKARQVKQDPMKTPSQLKQEKEGVKKI